MKKLDFDRTLLDAVDCALLSFGESPRKAIYYHLTKGFRIQKEDIPEDAQEFSQALSYIFGPGAEVIEKLIVKKLYSELNLNFEEKAHFKFLDFVNLAKDHTKQKQSKSLPLGNKTKQKRSSLSNEYE
jgi:hypothetical protein